MSLSSKLSHYYHSVGDNPKKVKYQLQETIISCRKKIIFHNASTNQLIICQSTNNTAAELLKHFKIFRQRWGLKVSWRIGLTDRIVFTGDSSTALFYWGPFILQKWIYWLLWRIFFYLWFCDGFISMTPRTRKQQKQKKKTSWIGCHT